jgi:hypothetical protein
MNVNRLDLSDSHIQDLNRPQVEERVPGAREVLEELFLLLEDYAPTWYTEAHHNRAVAALVGRKV